MLLSLLLLPLAAALPTPADPAPAVAAPGTPAAVEADTPALVLDTVAADVVPTLPLRWRTKFGDSVEAGKKLTLEWHGGDENGYEVYYVPRWPGQLQYDLVTIEANTTEQSLEWTVPSLDEYPAGTEFIFGIKDGSRGPGFDWYDLSAPIPFR